MSGIDCPSQKPQSQSSSNQQTTFTTKSATSRQMTMSDGSGAAGICGTALAGVPYRSSIAYGFVLDDDANAVFTAAENFAQVQVRRAPFAISIGRV
jgi:hypothetical protein